MSRYEAPDWLLDPPEDEEEVIYEEDYPPVVDEIDSEDLEAVLDRYYFSLESRSLSEIYKS